MGRRPKPCELLKKLDQNFLPVSPCVRRSLVRTAGSPFVRKKNFQKVLTKKKNCAIILSCLNFEYPNAMKENIFQRGVTESWRWVRANTTDEKFSFPSRVLEFSRGLRTPRYLGYDLLESDE